MSLQKFTWRCLAVITVLVASPTARAQVYHPHADPLDVNPDWQWFAPVDVDELAELSPRKRANYGWFGAYDRTHLWVSRPRVEESANDGDFGWGNRYDLGFMNDDTESGWLVSLRMMTGPNTYDLMLVERIDRVNDDDLGDPNDPVFPVSDRNDPQLGYRAYVLGDSLNVVGFSNFELNKVWRRSPYRYGGMLEPMVGFKYSTFSDTALNQEYFRTVNQIGTPGGVSGTTDIETLITDNTRTRNQMVGGQLGARYFNHSGRWTLSSELRTFAVANFQKRNYEQRVDSTEYDGLGGDVVITDTFTGWTNIHDTNTEFSFGFEARGEAAYQITRYFQIRAGVEVINFANGIWRGANPGYGEVNDHNQDVWLAGFTAGVTINR